MASLLERAYNPDVLTCLANLSNDEVFTPPELANQVLELLPKELWSDPNVKILDPFCKSGVFLREAAKRFIKGLEPVYPDLQERVDHIMHEQLYGIAITELTSLLSRRSLYCSKFPNGRFSVSEFDGEEGNIRYRNIQHTWSGGKCVYCGASQSQYDRDKDLETHAYEFIHAHHPEEIFDMKFDVIVGNPPYQLSDGGYSRSAKPIYQLFVEQAKKLNPRYLIMIIPARWFSGGRGLDQFRETMLHDRRIRRLVDFGNSNDVFAGVDIAGGICYFLWDRDYDGMCTVDSVAGDKTIRAERNLGEYEIFIRDSVAVEIIHKIQRLNSNGQYLSERVSSSKPFGIRTFYEPKEEGIPCYFIQRIGKRFAAKEDVTDQFGLLDKWKFLAPAAPIAGQTDFTKPVAFFYEGNTRIAAPGECCTESYIVLGAFDTEEETRAFRSYIFTKTVRFLLLQTVVSQHVTKKNYCFIPDLQHYVGRYTDDRLQKMWGISSEERELIDSRICEIGESRTND